MKPLSIPAVLRIQPRILVTVSGLYLLRAGGVLAWFAAYGGWATNAKLTEQFGMLAIVVSLIGEGFVRLMNTAFLASAVRGETIRFGSALRQAGRLASLTSSLAVSPMPGWRAFRATVGLGKTTEKGGDEDYTTALWGSSRTGFDFISAYAVATKTAQTDAAVRGTARMIRAHFRDRVPQFLLGPWMRLLPAFALVSFVMIFLSAAGKGSFVGLVAAFAGLWIVLIGIWTWEVRFRIRFHQAIAACVTPGRGDEEIGADLTALGIVRTEPDLGLW